MYEGGISEFVMISCHGRLNLTWQEFPSREILEKKWLTFFSLELENCIFISLFLLDFQDWEKILFLLSIYEILFTVSLSLPVRNASYFWEKYAFFRVWRVVANCYVMRFCGDIWCQKRTIANQNLNPFFKSKMSGKISLSPLEKYELSISLSLLKIGEQHLKFLFLLSKMEK